MIETLNAVQFAQRARLRSAGPIVLTPAGSAKDGAERVIAWSIVGYGLKLLDDRHVEEGATAQLRKILLGATLGTCDAKPGEAATWVWIEQGDSLKMWAEGKLRVGARSSGLEVRGASGTRSVPRHRLNALELDLSEIWDTIRLIADTKDGPVGLAAKTDRGVLRDPKYDEARLADDTAWLRNFAQGAAGRLGVPLVLPEDLQ